MYQSLSESKAKLKVGSAMPSKARRAIKGAEELGNFIFSLAPRLYFEIKQNY